MEADIHGIPTTIEVRVDRDLCQGHGRCNAVAADLFPLDEQGYATPVSSVAADRRGEVEEAVRACPERALRISSIGEEGGQERGS